MSNNSRYGGSGNWYKGNTHIHSRASDGGLTFEQLAEAYAGEGYDFLCKTDHWVCSDTPPEGQTSPLVWLDGVELDGYDAQGSYYHAVCVGRFTGITAEMGFAAALDAARIQNGLLILAHPCWSGNSFAEAMRCGFHGVEVYNHVCQWLNGKGYGLAYWQAMLGQYPTTLAFAVDDAHLRPEHPGWNGGWIMVQASERTPAAILDAIRGGRYYSTSGPAYLDFARDGDAVTVATSPVQFIRLVGPGPRGQRVGGFDGELLTEASFTVPQDWAYAYLDIEDAQGRRAWTNTL